MKPLRCLIGLHKYGEPHDHPWMSRCSFGDQSAGWYFLGKKFRTCQMCAKMKRSIRDE